MTSTPAPSSPPVSGNARALAPPPDLPIRVLIVDDDARVRAAIRATIDLERDLLVVGDAADQTSALAAAAATDPTIALVDVLLPDDAAGLALVRALSQRSGWSVVAMSVRSALRHPALDAGAVDFVEKGDDIDILLQSIRAAAQRKSESQ